LLRENEMNETDDKKIEEVKKWLEMESNKGNSLAGSFSSILTGATQNTRDHHYLVLHDVIQMSKLIVEAARNEK